MEGDVDPTIQEAESAPELAGKGEPKTKEPVGYAVRVVSEATSPSTSSDVDRSVHPYPLRLLARFISSETSKSSISRGICRSTQGVERQS